VVHPSVTVTHAALELLRKAGVRVIPYVESAGAAPEAPAPAPKGTDEETLRKVKEAVLARLGKPVDPAVLDAVLRRVLAAL
jgi:DNA-directed RNA polymerase specialized sigma24 family protein